MRIERFQIDAFGRLSGLSTGPDALPGLVVVLGPNEAGKSTVFHFLTSMLYGFYPASKEAHPYAPWDGADASGSMTVRLGAGGCANVERRLRSHPAGHMTVDGRREDLRNRTLPWAEHVPRTVFRQVYALTLAELAGLDGETWGRVQDRIVGAMGAADIRPARQVVAELEQEAGALWRSTRRGNQRIRELRDQARALRDRRRSAAEADRRLREMVAEAETVRARLRELRDERQRAKLAVERVQALVPLRAQLSRIESLREDGGPPDELVGFPGDPSQELTKLREQVESGRQRRDQILEERAHPATDIAAFGDAEHHLLDRGDEIARFLGHAGGLAGDRARLAALGQEASDLDRRIHAAAAALLTAEGSAVGARDLAAVPLVDLRERIRRLAEARDERRILEAAESMTSASGPDSGGPGSRARDADATDKRTPGSSAPGAPVLAVALLTIGLAALAVGTANRLAWATLGGAMAAVVSAVLLGRHLGVRATARAGSTHSERDLRERLRNARDAYGQARQHVADLLDGLPLRRSVGEDPDEALVTGFERIQELLRDREDRRGTSVGMRARIAEADAAAERLAHALGLDRTLDAEALSRLLDREVRRAERLREAAHGAERELTRLDRAQVRVEADFSAAGEALQTLTHRLEAEGSGDASRGAQRFRQRLQAATRADQLTEEMERAHPDLEEIRDRIRSAEAAGDSWTMDDDDLARRKARVEELTEQVESLATRAEALNRDAAHLRESETMDAVDGESGALQDEEQSLLVERDRLWLLAQLLRKADRRFREEHQPDLMRRAGRYLARLTGDRYDRIVVDESSGAGNFQLLGPHMSTPTPLAPPISTGTLEQAYLALRLSIVDHLDQGLEQLPLFVDEILANWDDGRRTRGLDLLAEISVRRQVFAFTCHPAVAREMECRGGFVLPVERDA